MPLPEDQINAEKHGKPRPDLVPPAAIMAAGRALGYGVHKHGGGRTGLGTYRDAGTEQAEVRTHVASFCRHWLAYLDGEHTDPESGLAHLDCAMAQLAIVVHLEGEPTAAERRCVPRIRIDDSDNPDALQDFWTHGGVR
jgi:hypothetical protein